MAPVLDTVLQKPQEPASLDSDCSNVVDLAAGEVGVGLLSG